MNKTFKTALAVALAAGSLATLSAPAQARDWNGGYGGYRHGGDGAGAAIAGGVVGLALGAAIASSANHDNGYRSYGYDRNYGYAPSYGYGSGYGYEQSAYGYGDGERQCMVRRRVWDGYDGRYEVRRVAVPC